ncbi:DUF6221 family protein [Kitasatospora sp. NPDC048239]|uniref:DUF6221 family protein n=1 Tax=Kitasatospora sp. NPDC048239 TaxID=3364046 RepID=UPI003717D302
MSADLVAFMNARLDEDEQFAQGPWGDNGYSEYNEPGAPGHHLRVLAEVDAKRRIIATCNHVLAYEDHGHWLANQTLAILAMPYRDHPNYQPEWAPDA